MAYNLLKGKKGIIFGALNDMSIAWKVAERAVEEGAEIVLTNTAMAIRMGEMDGLAAKLNAKVVACDASSVEDMENLLKESMAHFGGQVDFILHSIGMSLNVRKKRPYDDLNYEYMMKSLDISAISFHKLLQSARKLDAISEWGSVIALSYIAAQRTFYGYNEMAEAKAMLESIARSFGYIYGRDKKIRVNTISQSPTLTTAGQGIKGLDDLLDFSERMSPLGNASAEDCADYCIVMFSDLTKKVTMQNLFNDGGFSNVGMSWRAMNVYSMSLEDMKHNIDKIVD
jgi:enoyl-[acyl-carrier protein] reductase I